jgi:ribosomal protein S1
MIEKLKEGDTVRVIIEKIHAVDRKITLCPADLAEESDWKTFTKDSQKSMSPLAEKLQKALNAKDHS